MTRLFTKEHEWLEIAGDTATVGITTHAQAQLGDITFVELPCVGVALKEGDAAAVVESVKAASDVFCPAAGVVSAVNDALGAAPERVNAEAEAGGWLFKLTLGADGVPGGLMDDAGYKAYIGEA